MKNPRVFFAVLGFLVAAAAWMLLPFVTPVLVAAVMGYLLLPFYDRLGKTIRSENLRAALLMLVVLFLVALPVLLGLLELSRQAPNALHSIDINRMNEALDRTLGRHVPLSENLTEYLERVRGAAVHAAPELIGRVGATALSLLLFLYSLFFFFTDGRALWKDFISLIPLDASMKPHLVETIQTTMTGVLYGQVVTAAIQAALAGLGYLVFGLPHVLLWTALTLVASMLPLLGGALVWVPLVVSRFLLGQTVPAWGLLIYMGIFVSAVDHIIKPRLIAGRAPLHPLAALFGVIGGLHLFGIVGFVLGPVLLGLIAAMLRFYREMPHYKETAVE
jgi:predicted PurR-regulated permease PerM